MVRLWAWARGAPLGWAAAPPPSSATFNAHPRLRHRRSSSRDARLRDREPLLFGRRQIPEVLGRGHRQSRRRRDGGAIHRWLHGREVKLRLFREREGEGQGSVELVVETRQAAKDETEFSGSYVLTVSSQEAAQGTPARTLKARGRASCSLG
jgi:hypothetical protein